MVPEKHRHKSTGILGADVTGDTEMPGESTLDTAKTSKINRRRALTGEPLFLRVGFALVLLSFMGCASQSEIKSQQPAEFDSVKTRKHSVFLFKLSAEIDGKPINMLREFNEHRIYISVANIDKESPVERVSTIYTPLEEKGKENWFYLLLEPAAYYMEIRSIWQPKSNPILFYIPSASSLVYGGSLSFSCKGGLETDFECSGTQVANETEAAETIADKFFKEYPPLAPILAEIYADSLPESAKSELIPIGFLTSVDLDFEAPSWRKSIWSRTTGFGDWWSSPEQMPTSMKYYLRGMAYAGGGGAGIIAGYLIYLPFALPYAAIAGEASQLYWTSCMQRHTNELSKSDLEKEILCTIQKEIPNVTAENFNEKHLDEQAQKEVKSLLEVKILHIGLKECWERGSFCPEVSFCAKLYNTASKKLIYNKIFLSSNASRRANSIRPYFSLINASECREMKSYCADETSPVLKTEISNSIKAVVEAIKRDIGLPPKQEDQLPEDLDKKNSLTQ